MFESSNGDFDIQKSHINDKGDYVITAGLTNNGILGKTDIKARILSPHTITVDMFGSVFYRQFKYKMVTHARVFSLKPKFEINDEQGLFISNSLKYLDKIYGYENMCSWEKIKDDTIFLPQNSNKEIDFDFMESFIREIEENRIREIEEERMRAQNAYLAATGLSDYTLSEGEETALKSFDGLEWQEFNVKELFGKSTRGKRLKSDDRIEGDLPFVTAGEVNTGISAFISNDVEVFSKNTTTIDMFGSAKYRNYDYGADDHVAVVHTENLDKFASIFVATACHKSAHNGQFSYGHNFYAKDADELNIMLPVCDGVPDYAAMQKFISAVQKLVIKDVVIYADRKITATRSLVK